MNKLFSTDEYEGGVVRLRPRKVLLQTFDGNHVRLPHVFGFTNVLDNDTQPVKRLLFFTVGVGGEEKVRSSDEPNLLSRSSNGLCGARR